MEGGINRHSMVPIKSPTAISASSSSRISFQRLLRGFTRLDFAARELPSALVLAVAAGGGINFMFRLNIVADHSCDNAG